MRKLEEGISLNGKKVPLDVLAREHCDSITNRKNNFVSPVDKLDKLKLKKNGNESKVLSYLICNFKSIVTAKPREFVKFINYIGTNYPGVIVSDFKKEIEAAFSYKNFRRSKKAYDFFKGLGLKACPYCNAQFIVGISKSGKAFCHFDHIYSKSEYPYLSISYFNLVPCCSNCNQAKSDLNIQNTLGFISPYVDSLHNHFKFEATALALKNLKIYGKTITSEKNVAIDVVKGMETSVELHFKRFKIDEILKEYSDIHINNLNNNCKLNNESINFSS